MSDVSSNELRRPGRVPGMPKRPGMPNVSAIMAVVFGVMVLAIAATCYWWFVQRVEVGAGELLILIRKVGDELPNEPAVADQSVLYPALVAKLGAAKDATRYKGVVYEPLPEGRYFFDPLFWERRVVAATFVAQDEIGVKIRKYGKPLPAGKTVATTQEERGALAEILPPGRYNLNPFAYEVRKVKPVVIAAGHVGVQTLLAGDDPENPNDYMVKAGRRGVQPDVLPPGMYYNNPYVRRIDVIDVRSHTLDMHEADAISFPSNDSFDILVDCTVEYAIRQDIAPYVMVAIGDHEDIKDKIILPHARSLCRIEGSKLPARDFISGEMRTAFQKKVFDGLREQCYAQGIEIRATLIRRIVPPPEIAGPISERQVASQQIKQYENEMKVAESQARLAEQEEMQRQNQAIGQANREVVSVTTEAQQRKEVALIEAHQKLEVAKLKLQAAEQTAQALLARGQAEAEVARLQFEAEAKPLRDAVTAFGDGETYAQYFFYQRLGPALKSVLASTEGPFAEIFRSLSISGASPGFPAGAGAAASDPSKGAPARAGAPQAGVHPNPSASPVATGTNGAEGGRP